MNEFTIIIVGFLALIGISVLLIGVGAIQEMVGRRKSRVQGSGPNGWRYLIYNDTKSLSNSKVNEIAKSIMDNGYAVIPNNLAIELELTILEGGFFEVHIVDVDTERTE